MHFILMMLKIYNKEFQKIIFNKTVRNFTNLKSLVKPIFVAKGFKKKNENFSYFDTLEYCKVLCP